MGTTGERVRRRCFAEWTDALVGHVRCDKGQGHQGPHGSTVTLVETVEWSDPSSSDTEFETIDPHHSDETRGGQ